MATGLLTGSQGTYTAEDLRGDEAVLELLGRARRSHWMRPRMISDV